MADVFISYSQKDRDVAQGLADFLDDCGYDVWWDYELIGGVQFRNKIKQELTQAKSAIVIWTPNSVESDWVIEEADEAKQGHKLIATRVDGFDYRAIPLGFRSLQTDVVTAPERILRALEALGISPSRPPKAPKPDPVVIGKGLDRDAIERAEQFAHWEFIKDSQDPASFARFIEMFPASSFASLARIQLGKLATQAWHKLVGSEDVAALQDFVRLFPDDPHAAEANKRIDALGARVAEAASWARVKDTADLTAVKAHVAQFPEGANVPAARALLQRLQRERDAAEHWRALADSADPEAFEQFIAAYPDSVFTKQARPRLGELRRAQEEKDWNAVRYERHPAPLLRFLRTHPKGARAAEALELLGSQQRTIEQDAWAEIKDSDQPILFQAYLAALPNGQSAKAARTKLKALAAGSAPSPLPKPAPGPAIASVAELAGAGPPDARTTRNRPVRYVVAALLAAAVAVFMTMLALSQMSRSSAAVPVSFALMVAGIALLLAVRWLYFFGRTAFPDLLDSADRRSILFHAIGSLAILLWMALTQALAESLHESWSAIDNVWLGKGTTDMIVVLGVVLVAVVALLSQKFGRFAWLRFAWYALVPAIGVVEVWTSMGSLNGLLAHDYWVTTCVSVYGGTALVLFSAVVIVPQIVAWRRNRAAAGAASS